MKTKPKSLALSLRGYVSALLKDLAYAYTRPSDWKRDFSRLCHELGIKGDRLITLDFPAIGKHFDKCLDQGQYVPSGAPLTRCVSKAIRVPAFLRDLYLQVFDHDGKLRSSPDPVAIFAIRSILTGAKKLRCSYSERSLCNELKEFITVERSIREPSLNWLGDDLFCDSDGVQYPIRNMDECLRTPKSGGRSRDSRLHLADDLSNINPEQLELLEPNIFTSCKDDLQKVLHVIQQVADITSASFGDLHCEGPRERPKHGPGVVADLKKGRSKYDLPYWTSKTEAIFPSDLYRVPSMEHGEISGGTETSVVYHEHSSRIVAVPKTAKGPRLIAAEPVHHQYLQQLVWNQLEGRLENTPISASVRFRDQSQNQERARLGSIDGHLSTIDLSSASDRLSCWVVERMFRANLTLLTRLHASRTRSASWSGPGGLEPFGLILKKFAPMGSAATFPVQSIIYCIMAVGVSIYLDAKRPTRRTIEAASAKISVFGDDIIVSSSECVMLTRVLEYLGLKVNTDKTYRTGKFRESCGVDAYAGDIVTPARILTLPSNVRMSDVGSLVETSNNFHKKGLWNVSSYILGALKPFLRMIPITNNAQLTCALYSYSGSTYSHLSTRWNKDLQRVEARYLTVKNSSDRGPASAASRLLQWFLEEPLPDLNWSSGVVVDKHSKMSAGWSTVDIIKSAE